MPRPPENAAGGAGGAHLERAPHADGHERLAAPALRRDRHGVRDVPQRPEGLEQGFPHPRRPRPRPRPRIRRRARRPPAPPRRLPQAGPPRRTESPGRRQSTGNNGGGCELSGAAVVQFRRWAGAAARRLGAGTCRSARRHVRTARWLAPRSGRKARKRAPSGPGGPGTCAGPGRAARTCAETPQDRSWIPLDRPGSAGTAPGPPWIGRDRPGPPLDRPRSPRPRPPKLAPPRLAASPPPAQLLSPTLVGGSAHGGGAGSRAAPAPGPGGRQGGRQGAPRAPCEMPPVRFPNLLHLERIQERMAGRASTSGRPHAEAGCEAQTCRICWEAPDGDPGGVLLSPCHCAGSMKYVHLRCLTGEARHVRLVGGAPCPGGLEAWRLSVSQRVPSEPLRLRRLAEHTEGARAPAAGAPLRRVQA